MKDQDITKEELVKKLQALYQKYISANKKNIFQNKEIKDLVAALISANKELTFQNKEKENRADELRESEEKFSVAFKSAPYAITITCPGDGNFIEVNDAFSTMTGFTREETLNNSSIGMDLWVDKEDRNRVVNVLLGGRQVVSREFKFKRKNGEILTGLFTALLIRIKNNTYILSSISDITKQKRAEEALRESQSLYFSFLEQLPNPVFRKDMEGRYVLVNSQFCRLKGLNKENIVGFKPTEITAHQVSVSDEQNLAVKYSEIGEKTHGLILQTGKFFDNEEEYPSSDGDRIYMYVMRMPVVDSYGTIIGSQGIMFDITENKKTELKLKKALIRATESDRLKSSFLATISHELRTPLNVIIGFSGFLDRKLPNDLVEEFGELINSSGNHLLSIINDIFDITMIESSQTKIIKEKINLNTLLYNIHNIIGAEQRSCDKNDIMLKFIPPDREEDIIIYTDPSKLKQILINLLKNALKFTEKGHIHYGYSFESNEGKPVLQFYVKDTGIGIPENKKEVVFDVFRQVDESLSRNYGGTGIGLSISKKLTEFLGGKIWIESEEGKGSTFYFTIPFEGSEEYNKPVAKETAGKNNLKGKTILIAEDEKNSFKFLKIVLEMLGINTLWAKNGEESVRRCKENARIDLVLMDINMPVMDGYEATRAIKKIRPDVPVIAQTAYAIAGDKEKILKAGCDDYISKPIKKENLLKLIDKYLVNPFPGK